MTVRIIDLVESLPHQGTAMRIADTAESHQARSGAVSSLIGQVHGLRRADVDNSMKRLGL